MTIKELNAASEEELKKKLGIKSNVAPTKVAPKKTNSAIDKLNAESAAAIQQRFKDVKKPLNAAGEKAFYDNPYKSAPLKSVAPRTDIIKTQDNQVISSVEPIKINTGIANSTPQISNVNWKDTLNDTVTGVARFVLPKKIEEKLKIAPAQGKVDAASVVVKTAQTIKSKATDLVNFYKDQSKQGDIKRTSILMSTVNKRFEENNKNLIKVKGEEAAKASPLYREIKTDPTEFNQYYQKIQDDSDPILKALNTPTGKAIVSKTAKATSNLPLKLVASLDAIGSETYQEAYQALLEKRYDPKNNKFETFVYDLQDAAPQTLIGVLLSLGVAAATKSPATGIGVSSAYYTALSANEQLEKKGRVYSSTNLAIDVAGDQLLGKTLESVFKKQIKEAVFVSSLKSFGVEGGTEVSQSLLKYSNDYGRAQTQAEKDSILKEATAYIKDGSMANEFLIGGISGAGTAAIIQGISRVSNGKLKTTVDGLTDQISTNLAEDKPIDELIPEIDQAKTELKKYIEENKKSIIDYSAGETEGGSRLAVDVVEMDDGTFSNSLEVSYSEGSLLSSFDQSESFSSQGDAILDATEKILAWSQEQDPVNDQNQGELKTLIKKLDDFLNNTKQKPLDENPKAIPNLLGGFQVQPYYYGDGKFTAIVGTVREKFDSVYVGKDGTVDTLEIDYSDQEKMDNFLYDSIEEARQALQNVDKTREVFTPENEKAQEAIKESPKTIKQISEETKSAKEIISYIDKIDRETENPDFTKESDRGILPFTKKQVKSSNTYELKVVNIDELIKNDPDLKEYVDANEQRYVGERDFFNLDNPIVVGKNGEVYDGMNRILTLKNNGEKIIKAYVAKEEIKTTIKAAANSNKKYPEYVSPEQWTEGLAEKFGDTVKLYHQTDASNVDGILKDGFKAGGKFGDDIFFVMEEKIDRVGNGEGLSHLVVTVPKSSYDRLFPDERSMEGILTDEEIDSEGDVKDERMRSHILNDKTSKGFDILMLPEDIKTEWIQKLDGKETIKKEIKLIDNTESEEDLARAERESKIIIDLEMSTPGKKNFVRDDEGYIVKVTGEKSTFPNWLPDGLRLNSIIRPTLEAIYSGKTPTKAAEIRLYNLIYEKINANEEITTELKADQIKFLKNVNEFTNTNRGVQAIDEPFDGAKLYKRLESNMKRLGLNFDIALFDKIYTGEMAKKVVTGANGFQTLKVVPEQAAGAVFSNRLALAKMAMKFTDYHELIHIISGNISDIPAFSKYNKIELLKEAQNVYGQKYLEENFEEVMARGFEDFVYRRKTFTGRLKSFFEQLLYQVKQILHFTRRTNLKSFYEDVLYSRAKTVTNIEPTKTFAKITKTPAGETLDFSTDRGANFLRVPKVPSVQVNEVKPAGTPEELKKRIEQLNKVGQKNKILRRIGKLGMPNAAGVFVSQKGTKKAAGVGKEGEIRLKQTYVAASQENYVSVLAHETGHAIDAAVNGGRTNVDTYKVFGDNLTAEQREQLRQELRDVTVDLVGRDVYAAKPGYYNKPTELLARFFEKMFVSPGNLQELAPLATELIERNQITHPIIADMLMAAEGSIDKGQMKFVPLRDLRQTYHKYLGKTVGEIAYNDELTHRAMVERGKYVIEKFVKEKFKNVKDSPELLFRVAESIKITKENKPEFGTRNFVTAKTDEDVVMLKEEGWKRLIDEESKKPVEKDVDGKMRPVYWRQRYTQEEGKALYEQLSPAGKDLVNGFTAAREEAKDYFNREVIKAVNNINSDIEGWVHHYFPQEKFVGASGGKLKFRTKLAGAKQIRTGAEGYIEDLQLNMTKALTDLESAKNFNEFVRTQFAAVTKPLLKGATPDAGWVEVQGDVLKGAGTAQEKKMVVIKDGKSFIPKRTSYQMPIAIYERYKLYAGIVKEASKATQIMNDINRYWRVNILTHPGSAATNFISGGIQYGSKVMTDFYTELLTGKLKFNQTRADVSALLEAILPKGWSESPDWIYGADRSNFYGQFTEQKGSNKTIDAYADKALKLYGAVERYWKKVITISEKGRTLKGLGEMTVEGLRAPSKMERELLAEINNQVDLYGYDYDNVPLWLENHSKSAFGQAIKPFAKYPYKYVKQLLDMSTGIFDRTVPWQERMAKIMTLATIMSVYAIYKKKKEEERETPAGDETTPARLSPRGRLYIGKDDQGNEIFLRTAKYPFFNLTDFGIALYDKQWEEAKSITSDFVGGLHPVAELALMTATNYENQYDRYLPIGVKVGNRVATFVPGYRVLNDIATYFDPFQRKQTTFAQTFTKLIPTTNADLQDKLHGTIRTEQIPLEGSFEPKKKIKGLTRTTFDVELKNYRQDVALSFLTGMYNRRINPEFAKAVQLRKDENSKNSEATAAITAAATEFNQSGGLKLRYKNELIKTILGESPNPKDAKKIRDSFDSKVKSLKAGEKLEEELNLGE